jgi:hypothetical protein
MWSGQPSFALFPTSGRVYVWRTPQEAYNPACLVPTVKHGGESVTIWGAISWYSAGPIITVSGRIAASDYVDILGNQVHPMVQMFPDSDAVFQDEISPIHSTRNVQSWFQQHKDALQHLPRPAQSPDTVKPLWPVLKCGVRSRFPPPSSLKQLDDVLNEVLCNIPL